MSDILDFKGSLGETTNRFFIVIYTTSHNFHNPVFMDAVNKMTPYVLEQDFNKISLSNALSYLCHDKLNDEYILEKIEDADFLVCLMNQEDGTIAGFMYGRLFLDKIFQYYGKYFLPWVLFEIDILCGHSLLKGPGIIMMNFLKCFTYYLSIFNLRHSTPKEKSGFVLYSDDNEKAVRYYDRSGVNILNKSIHDLRFWKIPPYPIMKKELSIYIKSNFMLVSGDKHELPLLSPRKYKYNSPRIPKKEEIKLLVKNSQYKGSKTFKLLHRRTKRNKSLTPLGLSYESSIHTPGSLKKMHTPKTSKSLTFYTPKSKTK